MLIYLFQLYIANYLFQTIEGKYVFKHKIIFQIEYFFCNLKFEIIIVRDSC